MTLELARRMGRGHLPSQTPVWQSLHRLAAAALALRLVTAWWSVRVSHADELFQYLEQAHRLVYGYGFIPWEYRFGIRNWLLPGAFAVVLEALRIIGLDQPTVYLPMLKSLLALLSISVIYACYTLGRNLFCERTGRLAAIFSAFWYELIYSSTLPTPEVLGAYAIIGALAIMTSPPSVSRAVLTGLLLGLSVVLRLQYMVPAAALWVLALLICELKLTVILSVAGTAVLALAGLLDAWAWGTPFISYYNSVVFNIQYGVSNLFGQKYFLWYALWLTLLSAGLHTVAFLYGLYAWRRCWPLLLLIASVVSPHMFVPHKEYRFVFLAIPLLLVLLADAIVMRLPALPKASKNWPIAFAAVTFAGYLFGGVLKRDDRLLASLDLSRRPGMTALLDLSGHWSSSGAFLYLHRDVPFYFIQQVEGIPVTEFRTIVSHIVLPAKATVPPGFRLAARHGALAILEQMSPPPTFRRLPQDGREPKQDGVEDRFTPTVKPRF
jgi:GPI mannosyltransferase 3